MLKKGTTSVLRILRRLLRKIARKITNFEELAISLKPISIVGEIE
jgi:hypothetical protein